MKTKVAATIEDLYHVPENGKAEIIEGELVLKPPSGLWHNRAAGSIYLSLRQYELHASEGCAIGDNAGFIVNLPNRRSFSPDAAWYVGPPTGMRFLEGAPLFAVEVRSQEDYGPRAERAIAQKRKDYFMAGTLVFWDVDLRSEDVVKVYRAEMPDEPQIYRRGELAEAEPALPGWTMPVDDLFT